MFGIKGVVAAVTVATLVASSAFAADLSLAPGKPAGVNKAQIGTGTMIIAAGAAGILTAVAIVVSNSENNSNTSGAANTFATPSTSGTAP